MRGQGRVVSLEHHIGHLRGRHHRKSGHHSVRVLFFDSLHEKISESRASATAERLGNLEALEGICVFSLFAHHIECLINDLSALCVIALGPAVASAVLPEDHVVWAEEAADR